MARLRLLFFVVFSVLPLALSKSTIEPCSGSDSCNAMVGYALYTDLKVSEVGALFQVDPIAVLTANSIDISLPDVENRILPSGLFLRIPTVCSCVDGIRKSVTTRYKTRPTDTLAGIADSVYAGLVSADQIREANTIADPGALDAGQTLVIPLPCTCFNSTDNFLPAMYLSYVVQPDDTLLGIAKQYATTETDIMNVNSMGSPTVTAGDIISIPLPACASMFPKLAADSGLIVANGSYAITASHCVECSCGPGDLNLYCKPASLAVSCSSMQCRNSNLMLGNVTAQPTAAGCNVTSCTYSGYANGTILTMLSTSLHPQCPGQHQFPELIAPPTTPKHESFLAPSPSPVPSSHPGGTVGKPPSSVPGRTFTQPGGSANGPAGSFSGANTLVNRLHPFFDVVVLFVMIKLLQ